MMLLLESALRSLLLGLLVWALLKLLRLRDTATETLIWTVVLTAALSMPLLSRYLPGLSVAIPHLSAGAPAAFGTGPVLAPAKVYPGMIAELFDTDAVVVRPALLNEFSSHTYGGDVTKSPAPPWICVVWSFEMSQLNPKRGEIV